MLTESENAFITQTGPSTPMGEVMRRFWHPFLLSDELEERDGTPVRVKLLSEELIAFRDTNGTVGLLQERCPHRGASLFFGINQECGLLCTYHGWKFDVNGACVDMASDLPGSNTKIKVKTKAYPTYESAGVLWAYMGPPDKQPPPPNYMFNNVPPENVIAIRVPIYCNYLQALEGNIDSTHLGTLHARYEHAIPVDTDTDNPGYCSPDFTLYTQAKYRYAKIDVQDTEYGIRLIAIRPTDAGNQHIRINCHVLPYTTFIASQGMGSGVMMQVPIDDENHMRFSIRYRVTDEMETGSQPSQRSTNNPQGPSGHAPFTSEERQARRASGMLMDPNDPKRRLKRSDNDYMIDRKAQKEEFFAGITPVAEQDYALIESMGSIYDRTQEYLYPGDSAVIRVRQMLGKLARNLQEGIEPPGLAPRVPTHKIRSEEMIIGPDDDPWLLAADAGESAKRGEHIL